MNALAETYFSKSFRGYNPEQVDAFIISLSDSYDANLKASEEKLRVAEADKAKLRDEISELRRYVEETAARHEEELLRKQEEYDRLYSQIGEKMVIADTRAAEIIKNAEKEAAFIVSEARQSLEEEARTIKANAEAEASKLIEETRAKCADISARAEEFRLKQDEVNRTILETEKQFDDALAKLREGFGGNNDNK